MLTIHLHTGHLRTIEEFISSMEVSGYELDSWNPSRMMPTSTLKFRRPTNSTAGADFTPTAVAS